MHKLHGAPRSALQPASLQLRLGIDEVAQSSRKAVRSMQSHSLAPKFWLHVGAYISIGSCA